MSPVPPTLPEPSDFQHLLTQALPAFRHVSWLEVAGSTNADLLALAREPSPVSARPWLEGAHLQSHGRGRAGRSWQNRRGANLMFSCAFDIFVAARHLPVLSPLTGVATCEALRALITPQHQHRLTMKWPNDILWDNAKLAGILVESTRAGTARQSADHHVIIVGIGLNLDDARALSQSLDRSIADWSEIARQDPLAATATTVELVEAIAKAWYRVFNEATRDGFANFAQRYNAVDGLLGQHVHVLDDGRLIQAGIACGVNDSGQLLLRGPNGETALSVGEVSVRARQPAGLAVRT
jgi:BirA family biotin operon repressor/biotin-[acetyl-CoA-carboxylase] ligase